MAAATEEKQSDVIVVGSGMAGLVAAIRALEHDVDVTILEKGPRPGGSMYLSGGCIWTYESYDTVREKIPDGNGELQRLVIDSFDDAVEWLDEIGVTFIDTEFDVPGRQAVIEPAEFTNHMTSRCEELGGEILLRTPFSNLLTDSSGSIIGVRAKNESGESVDMYSSSVILATGGFQGNEELVKRYITDHPENLRLRSNPWSTGDGFVAAKEKGAKITVGLGNFYGHNLLSSPAEFTPFEFRDVSQYYGTSAIALDRRGNRFTDEVESSLEETLAQDTAKKADGFAVLVVDHELYTSPPTRGQRTIGSTIEQAREYTDLIMQADSLSELGSQLSDFGVNGSQAVETIKDFNRAIENDHIESLEHPRSINRYTIDTPPFYAVPVQSGITFTMGGIAVNQDMRVVTRFGSSSFMDQNYVPEGIDSYFSTSFDSLFAAGADVGNISHRKYMGGLSQALVTGKVAGEKAAQQSFKAR